MKKIFLILALLLCINTSIYAGNVIIKPNIKNFNEIDISGIWHVTIKQGEQYSIILSVPNNAIDRIKCEQNNNSLTLGIISKFSWFGGGIKSMQAEIIMPKLQGIDISGASETSVNGFKIQDFKIGISGASKLQVMHNDINYLTLISSGASNIQLEQNEINKVSIKTAGASTISGINNKIENLLLEASGAARTDFSKGLVDSATLNMSGAGYVNLTMNGGDLIGDASGGSTVIYRGKVKNQNIRTSGGARIEYE